MALVGTPGFGRSDILKPRRHRPVSGRPGLRGIPREAQVHRVEAERGAESTRLKKAWRRLRAPVVGLVLGLVLVKGYDRWRIARMTPAERRDTARGHCDRAREIQDEACRRLKESPIYLPKDVMAQMIAEYTRALEIDPDCMEALESRAYWRWFRGDVDDALGDYAELLRRQPRNALAWYQRGRIHCERGEHGKAIADYTQALAIEPHHQGGACLGARARCRMDTGDYRGALEDYQADGGYDSWPIGDCHAALGQHAEAVAAYDAYLKRSDAPVARYRRGLSRFRLGDRAGALEDFRRACQDEGQARDEAQGHVRNTPADPVCELLKEALLPLPERPR